MEKSRPLVKSKLNEWYDWLLNHVLKTVQSKVSNAFKTFKDKTEGLWEKVKGKETTKGIVEKEAGKKHEEDQEQQKDNISLTPKEHERALNGAYRTFRLPRLPNVDVDTNIEKITSHMKALIEQQIKDLGSAKVQLHMWVKWRKQEKSVIHFDAEELEELGLDEVPGVYNVIVEKVFNSKMMEIFQGSYIEEILSQLFAYIKTQIENSALPKRGSTQDSIMHVDINFYELQLTRGSSYIELPAWSTAKKGVINP